MIAIRPATLEDARYIGSRLRTEDEAEVMLFGIDGEAAIAVSIEASIVAECMLIDGEPAAVFGVAVEDMTGYSGCPWMLTTAAVERHQLAFARMTRALSDRALKIADRLENVIDARYVRAIKWLQWLGFTVEPERDGIRLFWKEA